MVVIVVLLTLTIPAFNGIGRSTSVEVSATNLRATLAMARQWAITHRHFTFVVFPDDTSGLFAGAGSDHTEKAFRAYNVYTQEDGWLSEWKYLADGLIFDQTHNPTKNVFDNANSTGQLTLIQNRIQFPDWQPGSTDFKTMWGVTFNPDGTIETVGNQSWQLNVYITEGWTDAANGGDSIDPQLKPGSRMMAGVELWPWSGKLKVREYDDFLEN